MKFLCIKLSTCTNVSAGGRSFIGLLVLLMLFFPCSEQFRRIPRYDPSLYIEEMGRQDTLSSSIGIIFQFMELTEEADGLSATTKGLRQYKGSEAGSSFCSLHLLLLLFILIRLLPAGAGAGVISFPFEANDIHSQRQLLRYQQRQDGVKIRFSFF